MLLSRRLGQQICRTCCHHQTLATTSTIRGVHASSSVMGGGTPGVWGHVWDWKIKKELAAKKAAKEAAAAKDKGQGKEGEDVVIVLDENTPEGALDKYFTDDDIGGPGGKPERKTRKFKHLLVEGRSRRCMQETYRDVAGSERSLLQLGNSSNRIAPYPGVPSDFDLPIPDHSDYHQRKGSGNMCLCDGCSCCACISTGEVGVIERNCKYNRLGAPGIVFMLWPFEILAQRVSLRTQQLNVTCETKTKDNVFVDVHVSVQYQVIRDKVYLAVYKLTNPAEQIKAYVYDVVRATLPRLELDHAFEAKDEIALSVKSSLAQVMTDYGYSIVNALVTDLNPDQKVRQAMNEINASKRLKEAARERAEGDKILLVKAAEAASESKYLSGVGVAKQRKAIVDGLRDSIMDFSGNVPGTTPKDVMDLLLLTQYFDMLNMVGNNPSTNSVFVPHRYSVGGPSKGEEAAEAIRDGMIQALKAPAAPHMRR